MVVENKINHVPKPAYPRKLPHDIRGAYQENSPKEHDAGCIDYPRTLLNLRASESGIGIPVWLYGHKEILESHHFQTSPVPRYGS